MGKKRKVYPQLGSIPVPEAKTPRQIREERRADLQRQLTEIDDEERREKEEAKLRREKWCLANIDLLLESVPEHEYSSCRDDKPKSYDDRYYDCHRCRLLDIKKEGWWPDGVELVVKIKLDGE